MNFRSFNQAISTIKPKHVFSSQIPAIEIKIPNFQHPNSKTSAASDSKGAIEKENGDLHRTYRTRERILEKSSSTTIFIATSSKPPPFNPITNNLTQSPSLAQISHHLPITVSPPLTAALSHHLQQPPLLPPPTTQISQTQ